MEIFEGLKVIYFCLEIISTLAVFVGFLSIKLNNKSNYIFWYNLVLYFQIFVTCMFIFRLSTCLMLIV